MSAEKQRQRFEAELGLIRIRISQMGSTVAQMIEDSVNALLPEYAAKAVGQDIVPRDDVVDAEERDLEHNLLLLVAREQPVTDDLRLVGASLKVIGDLERIGDNAVNISRVAQKINEAGLAAATAELLTGSSGLPSLLRLRDLAKSMVNQATTAFAESDGAAGARVVSMDDEADVLYAECESELRKRLIPARTDGTGEQAETGLISYLLFVANYLERVCDHSVNVAERAIYLRSGRLPKGTAADAQEDRLHPLY